jgi:hypothetical protein
MRPRQIDYHVIEFKASDFRDTQPAAAGQADNNSVASVVRRAATALR